MEKVPAPEQHRFKWVGGTARVLALLTVLAVIFVQGGRQIADKREIVKPIDYIGHADDASYALMGESLALGRGLYVPYVSTFYIKYPNQIFHREDHWPPFMGFSIAPFFYFFGKSAQVARIPPILYGSIGLPLAAAFLTYALSRRGYAAILAAMIIMTSANLYDQSLRVLSDIATAMLVAGFIGSVILARRHPWLHLVAGFFAACAYYSKGSEIVLLALYPVIALLCCGPRAFVRPWVYGGIATAVLFMGPFWYANWRDYGNPLHTTQNYVAGFYGFDDWDTRMYFPYWGKDLPSVSDRWTKYGSIYWRTSRSQLAEGTEYVLAGGENGADVWTDFGGWGVRTRDLLLGTTARWNASNMLRRPGYALKMKPIGQWQSPVWELANISALAFFAILLVGSPFLLGFLLWKRLRPPPVAYRADTGTPPLNHHNPPLWHTGTPPVPHHKVQEFFFMLGAATSVLMVIVLHVVFIAYFWQVMPRFVYPVLPLVLALGLTAATRLIEWPIAGVILLIEKIVRWRVPLGVRVYWPAMATMVFAIVLLVCTNRLYAFQEQAMGHDSGDRNRYPHMVDERFVAAGRWIGKRFPNAIVMCRNPWELQFYMSPTNKSTGLPYPATDQVSAADQIFAIARYYHVTHILVDDMRPALGPYFLKRKPGLTRVPGAPMALFEIDWSKIPVKSVEEALAEGK